MNPEYKDIQYKFRGKDVLLIDDNISSGATLDDVCLVLKKLGIRNIYVFTVATISPTVYTPSKRNNN